MLQKTLALLMSLAMIVQANPINTETLALPAFKTAAWVEVGKTYFMRPHHKTDGMKENPDLIIGQRVTAEEVITLQGGRKVKVSFQGRTRIVPAEDLSEFDPNETPLPPLIPHPHAQFKEDPGLLDPPAHAIHSVSVMGIEGNGIDASLDTVRRIQTDEYYQLKAPSATEPFDLFRAVAVSMQLPEREIPMLWELHNRINDPNTKLGAIILFLLLPIPLSAATTPFMAHILGDPWIVTALIGMTVLFSWKKIVAGEDKPTETPKDAVDSFMDGIGIPRSIRESPRKQGRVWHAESISLKADIVRSIFSIPDSRPLGTVYLIFKFGQVHSLIHKDKQLTFPGKSGHPPEFDIRLENVRPAITVVDGPKLQRSQPVYPTQEAPSPFEFLMSFHPAARTPHRASRTSA